MARPKKEEKQAGQSEKVTTVRLPKEWHRDLRSRAFHEETTITDLIKEALRRTYGYKIEVTA